MGVSKQQLLNTVRQLKEYIDYTSGVSYAAENFLSKTNIIEYTPTADYHPATKKYVDSKSVNISAEEGNAIVAKDDGIYVPDVSDTNISTVTGNAIIKKEDGLYVPSVSEVKINPADNNAIQQTENGIYVEDKTKTIDTIKNKVNNINLYQKYVNTELEYISLKMSDSQTAVLNEFVKFDTIVSKSSNISYNLENYSVRLRAGKSYQISAALSVYRNGGGYIYCTLQDITNDINLCNNIWLCPFTNDFGSDATGMTSSTLIVSPVEDMYVAIKIIYVRSSSTYINPIDSNIGTMIDCYFNVQEIGRAQAIDPLEHINENSGIEDTPIGHILTHIGTKAPKHYLICDGSEYNIEDYPYLAQHFINEFGTVKYYGGDGITTFAVPDLTGDYLKGAITDIGKQEKSAQIETETWGTPVLYRGSDEDSNTETIYQPANISVLCCIKYEPTYYFVNVPVEQVNEEIATLKKQNEILTAQNVLMQEQITQLSEILASINREV